MPSPTKTGSRANNSNSTSALDRAKSVSKRKKEELQLPTIHQTIIEHRVVISETPTGLIGEKVVYSEKNLGGERLGCPPLPECGYFTITAAVLADHGIVLVSLSPWPQGWQNNKGQPHIGTKNLVRYKPDEVKVIRVRQ